MTKRKYIILNLCVWQSDLFCFITQDLESDQHIMNIGVVNAANKGKYGLSVSYEK